MYTRAVAGVPFSVAFVVAVSVKMQLVTSSSQFPELPSAALKSVLVRVVLVNWLISVFVGSVPSLCPCPAAQSRKLPLSSSVTHTKLHVTPRLLGYPTT